MLRLNYEKKDLGFSFGFAVAVMMVASVVLTLIFGETQGWKFWLMQAIYTLLVGGSAFVYAALTKTNPVTAAKLNKKPRLAHLGWGFLAIVCLIFGMMPLNTMLMEAIEAMGLKRPAVELPNDVAGLIVVATILPAFCEELVFRGTVAQSAERMSNRYAALAISGALFALFHANPAQTLHQFVLGAFLTLLVFRSGSLWTSILAHLFNNALVVALNYTVLGTEEFWNVKTNTGVVLGLMFAGLIGFGLCVFGYLKTTHSVWQKNTEKDAREEKNTISLLVLCVSAAACLVLWVAGLFV